MPRPVHAKKLRTGFVEPGDGATGRTFSVRTGPVVPNPAGRDCPPGWWDGGYLSGTKTVVVW